MLNKRAFIICCLLLALTACPYQPCPDPPFVGLTISGSDSTWKYYVYAHGAGKEASRIYARIELRARYDSIRRIYNYYTDSSRGIFYLQMNMSRDTSRFCLVNKDLSVDTLTLSYARRFYAHEVCEGFTFTNLAVSGLPKAFKKDSSFIKHDNGMYQIHLKK